MRHVLSVRITGICLVLISAVCVPGSAPAEAVAPTGADATPEVSLRTLYSNVFLQTSAEYRACCYAIYAAAAYRLEEMMEEPEPEFVCPAVVMDLDMTVLDVSSFQTYLYVNGIKYTPEIWIEYERNGVEDVALVPGAKGFIEKAEELGVTVVYLSNRNAANQEYTVAALDRLGINTDRIEERIYLKPTGASSDKSARRDEVTARYNVVMYIGDNLRDFSDVFRPARLSDDATVEEHLAAIAERLDAVDDAACHWGVDWFVLPNPIYGEWEKLVSDDPADVLRPSYKESPGQ